METCSAGIVPVLSVSPLQEDHTYLARVMRCAGWAANFESTCTLGVARKVLQTKAVSIVICERDLEPGTWRDMLRCVSGLRDPPLLIVTSRFADEELWAEALNLGAFDVIAKPFDVKEVVRILGCARAGWVEGHAGLKQRVASAGGCNG